ncbi:MAG: flagellar basal body L-ring protein FlgH [Bdellovibrionales bacterium]|nr:flagellar basal body L-ring protein FlgH [Bdellovibrionales bacterium]
MKFATLILLSSLTLLTSCSSLIDGIYRDLDRQSGIENEEDNYQPDQFDQYRKNTKRKTSSVYNKPGRNRGEVTTNTQKMVNPDIKRQYQDEKVALKRVTANDLTDTGNDGSLWGGGDPNSFLFSTSKNKSSGDIIQINVLAKLKNEITLELKRAFPENPYDPKVKEKEKEAAATAVPAPPVAGTGAAVANAAEGEDRISGVVVEEINREHLLIKGRKNVLFKNRKRMVEVQALVSRKDIADNDTVNSDAILESNISVVR